MQFTLKHDPRNITDQDLIKDLCRVAELCDGKVKQREYKEHGNYGVTTVIRRFGGWNAAIEAAGLNKTVERNIEDEVFFEALYELWVALGRQPSYSEVAQPSCKYHVTTFERRFGSWRKALEAFVAYTNEAQKSGAQIENTTVARKRSRRTPRSINLRLRFTVLQRDSFTCCSCGRSPATTLGLKLQVDHIKAWSKGGETELENLQTLCEDCNQGKSNVL
ncbi:HNH endonuclease [Nitrospira defluvii]|nr:HNH endonuclease [Nitrospira defluvii]